MKRLLPSILILALIAGIGGFRLLQSQPAPAPEVDSAAIIQYLGSILSWYRQLDGLRQLAAEPDELVALNDNQQISNQVVRLAFDFARSEAGLISKQPSSGKSPDDSQSSARYQALFKLSDKLDRQVRETRSEIEKLRQKLATADERKRKSLETQISEIQSELALAEARKDSLRVMTEFVDGSSAGGLGSTGLRAEIEALARTVPGVLAKSSTEQEANTTVGAVTHAAPSASTPRSDSAGIWSLLSDLLSLSAKKRALSDTIQLTESVTGLTRQLRAPLVSRLREMSRKGDELAQQADSADQVQLEQLKKQLEALTSEFRQTSALVMPLSKQAILLDLYRRNLVEWQEAIGGRFAKALKSLTLRLGFLAVLLAVALAGAGLWRRAILRYVHDTRRRHQYLLLRKIVVWCTIALILVFSFANELGSVATFAGLITAGIAVALQGVILSMVGYFFLIGKFGIRAGDLVQVSGVTGEVLDIGLVRFHLLELAGGGGKIPTGRVVALPNSIVFQPGAGLFKQIPGTNFVWHEASIAISADCELKPAEERLMKAVESVFEEYRGEMEQQHKHVERTVTISPVGALHPASRLRLTPSGPEVVVRYPVDMKHAAEIDDRITLELLKAIEREPRLKAAGTGTSGVKVTTNLT